MLSLTEVSEILPALLISCNEKFLSRVKKKKNSFLKVQCFKRFKKMMCTVRPSAVNNSDPMNYGFLTFIVSHYTTLWMGLKTEVSKFLGAATQRQSMEAIISVTASHITLRPT